MRLWRLVAGWPPMRRRESFWRIEEFRWVHQVHLPWNLVGRPKTRKSDLQVVERLDRNDRVQVGHPTRQGNSLAPKRFCDERALQWGQVCSWHLNWQALRSQSRPTTSISAKSKLRWESILQSWWKLLASKSCPLVSMCGIEETLRKITCV